MSFAQKEIKTLCEASSNKDEALSWTAVMIAMPVATRYRPLARQHGDAF